MNLEQKIKVCEITRDGLRPFDYFLCNALEQTIKKELKVPFGSNQEEFLGEHFPEFTKENISRICEENHLLIPTNDLVWWRRDAICPGLEYDEQVPFLIEFRKKVLDAFIIDLQKQHDTSRENP